MKSEVRPKVLVLLAAYNGAQWIVEQISSILLQVDVDVRLVISDDGSSDETLHRIQSFAGDERVAVVSPAAPTGSAAQNFLWLIRNTPSEGYSHVALADHDDIWHKRKLIRACSVITLRDASGYSCAVTAFWADGRERILRQDARPTESDFLFEGAGQGCTFVLACSFYQRLRLFLLENPELSRHVHYHDWVIYAVSRARKVIWAYDCEPWVRYRQHERNDTGAKTSMRGIVKRISLIKSGWYAYQIRQIAEICAAAAPTDPFLCTWRELSTRPPGVTRSLRIAYLCIKGGRRKMLDKLILVVAALAGRI